MSFRGARRFVNCDDSNRRTWHHGQSFRGARSQKGNCSAHGTSSIPNRQLPPNRGRPFFRGNTRGHIPGRASDSNSLMGQNANGDDLGPWLSVSAVNDGGATYETLEWPKKETHYGATSLDETSEIMKACFDTDLRFQRNLRPDGPQETRTLLRNPYRLIDPQTSKLLDDALPILQSLKASNPWQQVDNSRNEYPVSREEGDGPYNRRVQAVYQAPAPRETAVQGTTQFEVHGNKSCGGTTDQVWNHGTNINPNRNYFETLKQKEQQKTSFGTSNPPLLQPQGQDYAWGNMQNGTLSMSSLFANSEGIPSFSAVSAQQSPFKAAVDRGSPGTPISIIRETWRNPQFQTDGGYTWRQYTSDRDEQDSKGSPAADDQPTSWRDCTMGIPDGLETSGVQNSVDVHKSSSFNFACDPHMALENQEVNRSQVDSFRDTCGEGSSVGRVSTRSLRNFSGSTPEKYRARQQQEDLPLPGTEFVKSGDSQSQAAADVHEVDESQLLPSDVDLGRLKYVLFFDINKKSFFEEVQRPFLPGSLLYFFYQDPAMLLPTKEHPFYKENAHNWVHFYPDCGTEYGLYQLAAPTVVSWMDQKVPLRVKFLVHGHQKQLKLDDMHRKVLYYPTSRVIDVTLLNRMLNGDFDTPRPVNASSTTGGTKTVVVRQKAAADAPGIWSCDGEATSHSAAYSKSSSQGQSFPVQEVTRESRQLQDGPKPFAQGHHDAVVHRGPPARKKICWDR